VERAQDRDRDDRLRGGLLRRERSRERERRDEAVDAIGSRVDGLNKSFDLASRRVGDLEETVHSLYELHEQLADELLNQQEKVQRAHETLDTQRALIEQNASIIAKQQNAMAKLEEQLARVQSQVMKQEEGLSALHKQTDRLHDAYARHDDQFAQVAEDFRDIRDEQRELRKMREREAREEARETLASMSGSASRGIRPDRDHGDDRSDTPWSVQGSSVAWGRSLPEYSARSEAVGSKWESVLALVAKKQYLEAYKTIISDPDEHCLLRLIALTGPVVHALDAESNSRFLRRVIHILEISGSEHAPVVFPWIRQAVDVNIHFTQSQLKDLSGALSKIADSEGGSVGAEARDLYALLAVRQSERGA
jgi:archaellum component FlaC